MTTIDQSMLTDFLEGLLAEGWTALDIETVIVQWLRSNRDGPAPGGGPIQSQVHIDPDPKRYYEQVQQMGSW